ncbi:ABC transporter permease [Cerasicoccus arenae]|uniref:ABC transporter permease n=1 Tax=Cerasicoccus arenae TaxID=424488 RepID=A0A8J3GBU9_9BACT|nr:ABC transporter permease subunit [Cerasicoccus arenae]MBK1856929.1 ABC transporter permease subunit [Cerasicoccus arenae]GHB89892.1 ABC transporter permease [Cerasicoccus arenae]
MRLNLILPILVAIVGMIVWACLALIDTGLNSLPGPLATADALWADRKAIFPALGRDAAAMVLGFLLACALGVLSAIVLTTYQGLRLALAPWMTIARMAPIAALAPLLIVSPCPAFLTLLIVTTVACYFPVVSVATPALLATDKSLLDLFKTYHASYWQQIVHLRLPHALPQLMTAIKRAAIYAPMASLLTDYLAGALAGKPGLGRLLSEYFVGQNYPAIVALCLSAAAVGVLLAGTVHAITAWTLMHWHDNENGQA